MTKDINVYESGDGGELSIIANDLVLGESLFNQVYLSLFGGNYEQNTKRAYIDGEERLDWWGNALLFNNESSKQFNSNTERIIDSIALNAKGRLLLINAINDDLSYLTDLLNYTIDVVFFDLNKIRIIINFESKQNQQNNTLILVYDNAKSEIIIEKTI